MLVMHVYCKCMSCFILFGPIGSHHTTTQYSTYTLHGISIIATTYMAASHVESQFANTEPMIARASLEARLTSNL